MFEALTTEDRKQALDACEIIKTVGRASVSCLQRRMRLGYIQAAHIVDCLQEEGIVGLPNDGALRPIYADKLKEALLGFPDKAGRERHEDGRATLQTNIQTVQDLVGRFRHLPPANDEPAHPLSSYYCDECGEADWVDTHRGGGIREFYADDDQGDAVCEPCARLRTANASLSGNGKLKGDS